MTLRTYNSIIQNDFNGLAPVFNMTAYPGLYQLDVGLVLSNLYNTAIITLDPPRGISDLNLLPATIFEITTLSEQTSRVRIDIVSTAFHFLTAGLELRNVTGNIDYVNSNNYTVTFNGESTIGNATAETTIQKIKGFSDYNIYMRGDQNGVIDYAAFNNTLARSFSTDQIELLPNFPFHATLLNRVNINQQNLHLYAPVVHLYFTPFLLYQVQGFHDTRGDENRNTFVQGTLANIDGQILCNFNFIFEFSQSESLFNRVFKVVRNDTATQAFTISRFDLLTSNRDFDLAKYQDLGGTAFASKTGNLWKRGVNATVELTLNEHCGNNTFCHFLGRTGRLTAPVTVSGTITNGTSILSGAINNIILSEFASLTNVYLQLIIEYDAFLELSTVRTMLKGNLMISSETNEVMMIRANITYPNNTIPYMPMSGRMLGIYDNLFGLNGLLDLVEVSSSGMVSSEGQIYALSINSLGILGQNCYRNSTLESSLMIQSMDLRNDGFYVNETGGQMDLIDQER